MTKLLSASRTEAQDRLGRSTSRAVTISLTGHTVTFTGLVRRYWALASTGLGGPAG
jgi:hypothetical protein